jgi:hypothetical protein
MKPELKESLDGMIANLLHAAVGHDNSYEFLLTYFHHEISEWVDALECSHCGKRGDEP